MEKALVVSILILSAVFFVRCSEDDSSSISFDGSYDETDTYNEKYKDYGENPFIGVSEQPVSTFSIDADGASYSNMRRYIYLGQTPPSSSVRIEEYINYFTFDYDDPVGDENVSLNSEMSTCPWNDAHCLLRVGMKGITIQESELPNSNYVFLIDVSGSMSSSDKLGILKAGFTAMVDSLRDEDRVAIVTYAGEAGVLLPSTYGCEKETIKNAINSLGAGGSTAGADGINTAYNIAQENYIENGNNRIILGTDGDFNVGPSSTEDLVSLIEENRETGIYITVLGVGEGNLNDYSMEQIADNGNGNYEYIDNAEQLKKVFIYEANKFYTIAKDSKIQITFNESRVDSFRLIGYENRSLSEDDFENDSTDAGEIGSAQTITALYELVLHDKIENGDYANFDFRYKKPSENESRLISLEINNEIRDINEATDNMRFAAAVTGFGLLMKQSEYMGTLSKSMVLNLGSDAISFDNYGFKKEFIELVTDWSE